jgi:tRNA(fMet)-specific endonuclease VapC
MDFTQLRVNPKLACHLWTAAHAKAAAITLVTNNLREFDRAPGLKIQNWAD